MLACLVMFGAGCDPEAGERRKVLDVAAQIDDALARGYGESYTSFLTEESVQRYQRLKAVVMEAPREQVLSMAPSDIEFIALVRNRAYAKDIEHLDGAGLAAYCVKKGWPPTFGSLAQTLNLNGLKVHGLEATAPIVLEGTDTGYSARFVLENDGWRFDELSLLPARDQQWRTIDAESPITLQELIVDYENRDSKLKPRGDLWDRIY